MASILSSETETDTRGTWQQAKTGEPSYVKVVFGEPQSEDEPARDEIANTCVVDILTSDAAGDGAGGQVAVDRTVMKNKNAQAFFMPAGAYHVNAVITRNLEDVPVTVEIVER